MQEIKKELIIKSFDVCTISNPFSNPENFHNKIKFCISEIERVLKHKGIIFITISANKYKGRASKFEMPEARTYIPLDGLEKGLPHFIYTKVLIRKDFKNFQILSLHKDKGDHWCILGRLK